MGYRNNNSKFIEREILLQVERGENTLIQWVVTDIVENGEVKSTWLVNKVVKREYTRGQGYGEFPVRDDGTYQAKSQTFLTFDEFRAGREIQLPDERPKARATVKKATVKKVTSRTRKAS